MTAQESKLIFPFVKVFSLKRFPLSTVVILRTILYGMPGLAD